jgi:hypothetical protein
LSAYVHGWSIVTPESVKNGAYLNEARATPYATPDTHRHELLRMNADEPARVEVVTFWTTWWSAHQAELTVQ